MILDDLAHGHPWRSRHPAEKALLALGLLGCAVALPLRPAGVLAGVAALVLLLGPLRLRPGAVLRVLRAPMAFVLVGALPLLVAVGGDPLVRPAPGGPAAALALAGRGTAALLCLVLLAVTVPPGDALPRLVRLGVPPAVVEVAGLVHRMLFLLLDTAAGVRDAQAARLGYRDVRTGYRSVAGQAAAVFVAAFDRARRLEEGLALRGYDGTLRVVAASRPVSRRFVGAAVVLVAGVAGTGLL